MAFHIDRMTIADVPEVMAIERDSFLTPWPGSAYRRELNENRNAHYLVLRMDGAQHQKPEAQESEQRKGFWSSLFPLNRPKDITPAPPDRVTLAGYAGLWLMLDEAHVTTIAVRPTFRGRGLGELLLVGLTEIAYDINARWLTLEVRVSNESAQALYRKYGFKPAGVRQRYYSDNQEDALIMWTDELRSPDWQRQFEHLRVRLRQRLVGAGDLAGEPSGRSAPVQS